MWKRTVSRIMLTLLFLSLLLPSLNINSAKGTVSSLIKITDYSTGLNSTTLGNATQQLPPDGVPFTVNVTLSGLTNNLATWQVGITFDNNSLRCTNISLPENDPSYVFHGIPEVTTTDFSDTSQNATYSHYPQIIASAGILDTSKAVNVSNALLCVINFTASSVGEKSEKKLSFLPTTTDTFLWDNNGVDIGFANQTFSVNLLEGTIVPDYYPTIQSAINGVNSGDTILVRKGTYHENVVANKTVALLGEDRNGTIIDGNGAGYVVGIKGVNNVSVCNFTIQNGQTGVYAGDWGTGAGSARGNLLYNVIKNNTGNGIYLDQTGYFVSGNDVANNGVGLSIYGQGAVNGTFRSNGIENNSLYNLELNSSAYDQIDMDTTNLVDGKPVYYLIGHVDETVPSNAGQVTLVECSNIVVQGLGLTKNSVNLQIVNSVNCTVRNTNSSSADIGISLLDSKNCSLSSNALADCRIDLQILESQFNNVTDNVFQISGFCGVDFGDSANNSFYHNTMNSVGGASMVYRAGNNTWDNGYPSGGNYWSDYAGVDLKSGPNQNINGSDGIGDTPYVIDANNTDHYPLMAKRSLLPVHDIDTGLDYATLQAAINAPETLDGNRIHVDPGTYYEHLAVNKSVALRGDNSKTTIIDGSSNGTCVNMTANNVNLTGFTVRNGGSYPDCGVIVSSTGNVIEGNIIENNDGDGIDLLSSSNWNILISNDVLNNNGTGILVKANDNTLNWNTVSDNNYYGVLLQSSWNDTLNNNTVMGNDAGICIWSSSNNNTLNENNVTGNSHYGIWFEYSSNNTLAGNKVTDNGEGVLLQTLSSFNSLIGNDVENSHNCGLEFVMSPDNKIYHNNFVNDANIVGIQGLVNLWDNGYPGGGNYWNGLNGSDLFRGVYQNETGSDGIIDTAYVIGENNTDHFPLTKPYAGSHDIGLVTVDTSNNAVGHTHLWIYAEVINYGEQTETFNVTVMANSTIVQRQVVTLTARNSITITFVWNTTRVAEGNYSITAVADVVSGETYTADNNLTMKALVFVSIPGDVSGPAGFPDGIVDMHDVNALVSAFCTRKGSALWNPSLDVNDDGVVNMRDIYTAIVYYTKI